MREGERRSWDSEDGDGMRTNANGGRREIESQRASERKREREREREREKER